MNSGTKMRQYIGVKVVKAEPMTLGMFSKVYMRPMDGDEEKEGYLVSYPDGYESWSPKEVFEEAYRLTEAMTFGHALEALKKGYAIQRENWNGPGQFVYYVPENNYPANTEIAKQMIGDYVSYGSYLALKTVNGTVSTWVPSISDLLAEDWRIVRKAVQNG